MIARLSSEYGYLSLLPDVSLAISSVTVVIKIVPRKCSSSRSASTQRKSYHKVLERLSQRPREQKISYDSTTGVAASSLELDRRLC